MKPLLVYPDPPPVDLVRTLDLGGHAWKAASTIDGSTVDEPEAADPTAWSGAVIDASEFPDDAFALARTLRKDEVGPILLLIGGAQLDRLSDMDDLFDDFALTPFHPRELEARLRHLRWRTGDVPVNDDLLSYADLSLNLETYQAAIEGRPLDLTYMEYELLKFLATSPGTVFTRETLLNKVWGYEYYGGARTVDVHVRRLRAKLGEEHAGLIQTVRSVGYRFGQSRWLS